eukprot:TRINITY_DN2935_c0_g1_i1.p1 TRINITY_DN2935_c0_g1~~TRINITY_DN2935_c0_g1_i1.p1  ORF type:complete len:310 (-),score=85.14 TRINITY_DN2935_c0_g1_i1:40-969(-)
MEVLNGFEIISKFENNHFIDSIQYSPFEESQIAVGTSSLTGEIWDGEVIILEKGKRVASTKTDSGVTSVHYAGTKEKPIILASCDDSNLLVLSAKISSKTNLYPLSTLVGHDDIITSVDVFLPKQTAYTSSWDKTIRIWDLQNGSTIGVLKGHGEIVNKLSCSEENKLASVSKDENIIVWDANNGKISQKIASTSNCNLNTVKWDGENRIIAGNEIGEIILIDLRQTDSVLSKQTISRAPIKALNTNKDFISVGSDDSNVYLLKKDNLSSKIQFSHDDFVRAIDFDPFQNNQLSTGSYDKSIYTFKYSF